MGDYSSSEECVELCYSRVNQVRTWSAGTGTNCEGRVSGDNWSHSLPRMDKIYELGASGKREVREGVYDECEW
jgi:hypothetical protein